MKNLLCYCFLKTNIFRLVLAKIQFLLLFLFSVSIAAQNLIHHSTSWFGPNANPVPEFTDATIPSETHFRAAGDYYFGHGDQTISSNLQFEFLLIKQKVSVKTWAAVFEHYQVTDQLKEKRKMMNNSGTATGDLYVQTRVSLLKEKKSQPAVILNATLKTASGSGFRDRRFFNTAGYYFDIEAGKSWLLEESFIKEFRAVGNAGFFSWDVQTPGLNVQDDAPMYGVKFILKTSDLDWENALSGYNGWIHRGEDYGNKPMVFASKLSLQSGNTEYFIQFQKGIRDFPYDQIRLGLDMSLASLTPKF